MSRVDDAGLIAAAPALVQPKLSHRQASPNPLKRRKREPADGQQIAAVVDRHAAAASVKEFARALGFQFVGIAPAERSRYRDYFRQWLDAGRAGEMTYLSDRFEERTDPTVLLPGAKSVVCVAISYFSPLADREPPADGDVRGRIARYALGDDYHEQLKPRLFDLADHLRVRYPGAETHVGVDSAPMMEKELAARAGIGWQGKNTLILNASAGSWLLLGEVVTTLDLQPDEPAVDRCGTCTRCIDACPTSAITQPYQLDATRCISYLTIEQRAGMIDPSVQPLMGNWLFGCDVCQEVCPFNRAPLTTLEPSLQPRFADGTIDASAVADWGTDQFNETFRHSAVRRIKLPVLQRNAAIVQANADAGRG